MKNNLSKAKKFLTVLFCCTVTVFTVLTLVSHLYYHRSLMSSFSEWYMMLIDRDSIYSQEEVRELITAYGEIGEEGLWTNLEKFLKKVIPDNPDRCYNGYSLHLQARARYAGLLFQ